MGGGIKDATRISDLTMNNGHVRIYVGYLGLYRLEMNQNKQIQID